MGEVSEEEFPAEDEFSAGKFGEGTAEIASLQAALRVAVSRESKDNPDCTCDLTASNSRFMSEL